MSGVGVADDVIRSFFERWKNLEAEKAAISEDLRELFAEMKGSGFDTKVARKVFRDKTVDQNERAEFEAIYDLYWSALSGPRAGRAREEREVTTPNTSNSGANGSISVDLSTTPEHEPQPSLMAGKAAASIPPEVAAEIDAPETATRSDQTSKSTAVHIDAGKTGVTAGETASPFQSSDLHDGRLQAVPAPALDESRDSAAGVEAPAAPVIYPAPGIVTYERCPPEPVRWHEYADCFPETEVLLNAAGIQRPIVKIDNVILDGRSRYHAARDAGIEYPVVQYNGDDPLAYVIHSNLESRDMSEKDKRAVASRLSKLVPDRTDEIMGMFGLEMAEAMA